MSAAGSTEEKWSALGALILVLMGLWLAVSTQAWAQTILLAGLGGLLLWQPPAHSVSTRLSGLVLVLLALAATTFLPAFWFAFPPWRTALQQDLGVPLGGWHTLQPWLSLEDFFLLLAGVMWGWHRLAARVSFAQRRFLLGCFILGGVVVAIMALGRAWMGWDPAQPAEGFWAVGQFANRNQTGNVLALTGFLGFTFGLETIRAQRASGGVWVFLSFVILAGALANGSRASVLLFFAGIIVWLLWTQSLQWQNRWLWVGLSASLCGLSLFLVAGNALWQRLFHQAASGLPAGFRGAIYHDTAALVTAASWNGVGLGNFEGVFNTVRDASAAVPFRVLHPESDAWWLTAEMGWGAVVLFLLMGLILWWEGHPQPRGHQANLRKACWVAVGLFLVHGLVDVSGHRMGSAWAVIYVLGLGLEFRRATSHWHPPAWIFRAAGLGFMVVAALRWQSATASPWLPTRASVQFCQQQAQRSADPERQGELIGKALAWAPLNWELYFQRAQAALRAGQRPQAAADFRRARFLEQVSWDVPLAEAEAWKGIDPARALGAWQEALQRAGTQRETLYRDLLQKTGVGEGLRAALREMAGETMNLRVVAIIHRPREEFGFGLNHLLKDNPSLEGVAPVTLRELLVRWAAVGDTELLWQLWPLHPEWHPAGWSVMAQVLAKQGRYAEALDLGFRFAEVPVVPALSPRASLETLAKSFALDPRDPVKGLELYFAQREAKRLPEALQTLQQVTRLATAPSYTHYLLAKTYHETGQLEPAWQALTRYLTGL